MNNNGFYALAFDEGGYGEIQWPLKEGSRFTICVKYLNDCCSENGSLIELNNVFTLDIREGELCLNDMNSGCKLLSECFGTIYIVYDGNDLKLYSESIPVYKTGIKPKGGKADRLLIGRGLRKSYIRSVTVYNEAFSADRMKDGLFNIVSGYEKHIDFTENKSADMVLNNCHIENMVYALDCRKGTVSSQLKGITEEYTILLSFYALENEMSKGVLFSSGDISISLESDDLPDRFTLCLKYGDKKLYTAGHISAGIWTDIELVQRKNVLELYSNGIKWGAANGTFGISDKKAELGSFKGYIDSLMILNEAVSEEKMKEFTDAHTHMFDSNVICCCEFSDNRETEIRKGIPLIYTNSEITLVKGTNAKTETASASLPSATGEFDNFDKWEINILSALILNWLHNVTGVYPDRGVKNIEGTMETTPEFDAFFYDRIAECPEAQKILYDYDVLNDKKLIAFISALTASGAMAMLIYYVYKNAKKCKAIIAFIKAVLFSEEAKDVLFGTLVLVAVAVALKIIGEIPRPPERKKHSDIFIESVSVENTVISIDGTGEDANARGVIVKNKPSKLKITLSCTGYDRSFTIKTGAGKDSIISTVDKKVVFEDKKSAELTLDIQTEKFDGSYGKYKAELKLSAVSSDSEQKFLGALSIVLYILENTPCSPWDKSVKISVLELFGKCYESEKGSSKDFLTDYATFIEKQPDKGAGSAREYSSLPNYLHNSVIFNTAAFSDAVLRQDKTSPADKVFSIAMLGALNGCKNMKAACISSDIYCEYSGGKEYISKLILDDKTLVKDEYHFVVMDGNGRIYDNELKSRGLPFSDNGEYGITGKKAGDYYRESLYMEGSACKITYTIGNWSDRNSADGDMKGQSGYIAGLVLKEGGRFQRKGRSDYDREVYAYIGRAESEQDICHSISAENIDDAIAFICNNNNGFIEQMNYLINALYPYIPANEFVQRYYHGTVHIIDILSGMIGLDDPNLNTIMEHFCYRMTNSPCNLRAGNSTWNRVLQTHFDPAKWFFADTEYCYSCERGIDNTPESIDDIKRYYGFEADIPETGFYLPDVNDGIRIHNMRAIHFSFNTVRQMCVYDYDKIRPLLASSSNIFLYRGDGDIYKNLPKPYGVYYLYGGNWIRWI